MIISNLKSALKIFKHNLFYSSINIIGLALGIACSVLMWMWVSHELSFENFHQEKDRIYRVVQDMDFEQPVSWAINQGPLGPSLVQDFPELEKFTRFKFSGRLLENNGVKFRESGGYADPDFFDIFSCKILSKSEDSVFMDNRSIALSKSLAKKYFGDENPLGKFLRVEDTYTFMVTAIFEDMPKNTHLWFDYLFPMSHGKEVGMSVDRWNNSTFYTYVLAVEGTNKDQINEKIRHYLDEKPTLEKNTELRLQAISDIHLYSNLDFDFASGDIKYVRIFLLTAILILLLACINFMSLSSARSIRRAKEIGVRKVIGARKFQLITQNLTETFLQVIIAIFLSLLLVKFTLPYFNDIAGKELVFNILNINLLFSLIIILLVCILISGLYPAIQVSLFNPALTLKGGSIKGANSSIISKALVVFQFLISVVLIISVITVQKQIKYFQNTKIGYEKDHILTFRMTGEFYNNYDNIKAELLQSPYIKDITRMAATPDGGYIWSNTLFSWEGSNSDKTILFRNNSVGYDYVKTFKMKIVEGRAFSPSYSTDTLSSLIINQTAAKSMGMENPIGQRMKYNNEEYFTIIGVVEDYNFVSLENKIEPLILWLRPDNCGQISIRIDKNNYQEAINYVENKWDEHVKENPFSYNFMGERLNRMYASEEETFRIITYFAILAILISCLGLFGLTSYMVERKMKEIGIRKVFGGSMGNINSHLIKYFLKWVLLANIIAWPISWLVMSRWLSEYAYHTNLNYWIFGLALVISMIIALATIIIQSSKAASKNPIDILRYE